MNRAPPPLYHSRQCRFTTEKRGKSTQLKLIVNDSPWKKAETGSMRAPSNGTDATKFTIKIVSAQQLCQLKIFDNICNAYYALSNIN